jgi:hypothetical protein
MYLRMAVELLPSNDPQRARLLARLGLALAWSLTFEDAVKVAGEAGELLAATEGNEAAADYLATAARATAWAGCMSGAGELAERGMGYVAGRNVGIAQGDAPRAPGSDGSGKPRHPIGHARTS